MNVGQKEISIQALRAGDRREFARLVDAFSSPLYRLALKMIGNEPDAEDILQNTFLKVFEHIGEFEGRSSLSTWLYRVASNEALMLLRKKRKEINMTDIAPEAEGTGNVEENGKIDPVLFTDWCCLPEEEFVSTESRATLDRAIRILPEKLRIVFILRDIENLSILETCQVLGLSETAVKTRLLRARLRLREELSSYYGERMSGRKRSAE
jgi:RNA polymerase sigma-70 factor, ECF subfamily